MQTGFFLYRSKTALHARSAACDAILTAARGRNAALDLTGYLHCEDGHFYQWLEGPPQPLTEVGALIEGDPRHFGIEYLWRGTQPERRFSGWAMGFGAAAPGTLFDWVAERGVHVGNRGDFARGVLDFMQSASGVQPAL